MKGDTLKQYVQLREALLKEKSEIQQRLNEINQALGQETAAPASAPQARQTSGDRTRNQMSLKKAVIQVTSERPLTKEEILAEVAKLGYQFNAKNPVNSLNVVLYGKSPRFHKQDGRFSPKGRPGRKAQEPKSQPAETTAAASTSGKPRRKRKLSAETKAKIAAGQRARWAREHAKKG